MRTKKTLVLIFILCLTVTITAAEKESKSIAPPTSFANYLPDSTLIVLSVPNVQEITSLFSDPKYIRILEVTGLHKKIDEGFDQLEDMFTEETGMKLSELLEAISGGVTFAVLDSDFKNEFEFAIFIGLAKDSDTFQKMLASAIEKDEKAAAREYSVGDVKVIGVEGEAFFAFHADHFVVTNSFTSMGKVLAPPMKLADSAMFRRHVEMTRLSDGAVGFANIELIMEKVSSMLPPAGNPQRVWIDSILELLGLNSLKSVSMTLPFSEGQPLRMFVQAQGYGGLVADIFSAEPVRAEIAAFFPADCDSFAAFSISKPIDIVYSILKWVEKFNPDFKAEQFYELMKPFEAQVGISIQEDLLKPLGSVFGVGVKLNPDAEVNFPQNPFDLFKVMEFTTVLGLDDQDVLLASIRKLAAVEGAPIFEEQYNGAVVFSTVTPVPGLEVGFAIYKDSLIFSLNEESLKAVINGINSGQTLASSQSFRSAMSTVPAKSCMISYTSPVYFEKYLKTVFSFMPQFKFGEDEERVEQIRSAVLDFLGPGKASSGYAVATDDGLYMEANVPVKMMEAMIPVWISVFMEEQFMLQEYE